MQGKAFPGIEENLLQFLQNSMRRKKGTITYREEEILSILLIPLRF